MFYVCKLYQIQFKERRIRSYNSLRQGWPSVTSGALDA